jgi:predicted SnoaL-like aldol condensation-catalyzing enzyme
MSTQKKAAEQFLQLVAAGKIDQAYDQFIDEAFIHHNAYFKGDRKALKVAMEENAVQNPQKTIRVYQIIEEADKVVTHSHICLNPSDKGIAVVHIFRFVNGKVVELWDLGMIIPAETVNEKGMF